MLNLHTIYPHTDKYINYNDFYYLPEPYTNYAINLYGEVLNLVTLHYISISIDITGYPNFRVWNKGDTKLYRSHRLLAIIFLPVPTFTNPVVNHISGVKTDNRICNLEWTTMQGNSIHAFATGLRSDNIPIVVTDMCTGKEIYANSYSEAGRLLNIKYKSLHRNATKCVKPYKNRWKVRIQ